MSGGSMDYLCYKVENVATDLIESKSIERVAFGQHLLLVSEALHDIEWADSGDTAAGSEICAIKKVVLREDLLNIAREAAEKALLDLRNLLD